MRINGHWKLCDDGIMRPMIRVSVLSAAGAWHQEEFLLDTGADNTVFTRELFDALELPGQTRDFALAGVGGQSACLAVATRLVVHCDQGAPVSFKGEYASHTVAKALDESILGRDILQHFATIVDQPANTLCLLKGGHRYTIQP
ncbi:MAG: hypothetical protein WD768_05605 [Phycisphaeraceae bacterium]